MRGNKTAPKLRAAALVFSAAFAGVGCGAHPQCQVNYRSLQTQLCKSALESYAEARREFRGLNEDMKKAKQCLRKKIGSGETSPAGIEEYNRIRGGKLEILQTLSSWDGIKRDTQDGTIDHWDLNKASGELEQAIKQIRGLREELKPIIHAN